MVGRIVYDLWLSNAINQMGSKSADGWEQITTVYDDTFLWALVHCLFTKRVHFLRILFFH